MGQANSPGWHSDSAPPSGSSNTVAAQRRILTVFPIYFLRLPAASRVFSCALIVKRRYAPYLTIITPALQAPFSFYPVNHKKPCRFRQGLVK